MDNESPIQYDMDDPVYVAMEVYDFNRAKKFYTEIFGFTLEFDGGEEVGWCELNTPFSQVKIGLSLKPDKKPSQNRTRLTLNVLDIDATKKYFESKEVETTEITDIPDMVSYFDIRDSEGNLLQFVSTPRVKTK